MQSMRPQELAQRLAEQGQEPDGLVVLDVRQPEELAICQLEGVVSIPLGELTQRYEELDPEAELVCVCHHGMRSARAAGFLMQMGFTRVWNLTGGMDAWSAEVDPSVARY